MLLINQIAPEITANGLSGENLTLSQRKGKMILVKFHRFSGCPVARRQVHEFSKRQNELNAAGIETIIFLHSTREKILPLYQEVSGLHIIADRNKKFYQLYNVEFSWIKTFSIASWAAIFKSFRKGYFPWLSGFQGGITGIPSDFLIDGNGMITDMHCGKNVGDSWTVSDLLAKSKLKS